MKRKSDPSRGAPPPATIPWTDPVLVVFLSGAIFVFAHFQALTRPWVINDDVRQQIFWMQQWGNPELFPGDLLTDYARAYVSWGVKGLYRLASPMLDLFTFSKLLPGLSLVLLSWGGMGLLLASPEAAPITLSKLLPGLLFVFLGWCLFRIGARLGSRRLAWFTVGVYWLMPFFLDNLSGGLARAFAAPLLAFFCLCWLAASPWGLALALLLQALFIPYIFLIGAGATVLAWLAARTGRWPAPSFLNWGHLLMVAAGAGLVLLMNHQFNAAGYGPLVSAADLAQRPEFTAQGRYAIMPVPSFFWELVSPWEFIAPFQEGGIIMGALGCALLLGAAVWGVRRLDWQDLKSRLQPFWYLLLASLLLYLLARVFLLKLFVPDRYLMYTLNLCYLLGLALCLEAAMGKKPWPWVPAAAAVLLVAILSGLRLQGVGLMDYSMYRPLYTALAQTPKNALIAGHPNLMDNVITFAKRPALATFELAHPWSKGYWEQLRPRLEDLFTAYYADDPQVVRDFCRKYNISFLVVDDRHFTPDFLAGGRFLVPFNKPLQKKKKGMAEWVTCPFFAPFDGQIRRLVQGRSRFVLLNQDLFPGRVVDEHLRVLDMRPWLQ
ncbi:MAG: hypothetical protein HY790_04665 [Deltaproteobacteria bacterium]|nr:hypothetical protein [Deltaproteobacteria bacterium]